MKLPPDVAVEQMYKMNTTLHGDLRLLDWFQMRKQSFGRLKRWRLIKQRIRRYHEDTSFNDVTMRVPKPSGR